MKFSYEPLSKLYYVTNLRKRENKLKWDTGNGGMTVVIQSKFGEDVTLQMDKICEKLSTMDNAYNEEFVSLAPEIPFVYAMLLDAKRTAQAKARGGLTIKGDVSRFTVLACKIKDEECTIFEPGKKQVVDIPAEIRITYQKVYDHATTGFLRKKQVDTFAGFYEVKISDNCVNTYQNGAICYNVDDINIPVTKAMIEAESFYIKAETMPSFRSLNEGYSISVTEIED